MHKCAIMTNRNMKYSDGMRPPGVDVPTGTPSVSGRFSRRLKVATSRWRQPLKVLRPTAASSGGTHGDSRQNNNNHRRYQVTSSIPLAVSNQQSGAIHEQTTQETVVVPRTRLVNALLRMGCIPHYSEQMD
jgi:hypothetical protein